MSKPLLRLNEQDVIAMRRRLTILADVSAPEFMRAAHDEYKIEAREAKRITPVDTGDLRDTVDAFEPEQHGSQIFAGLEAGGEQADYALYVHEDMEAFHRVGEAKFIAKTMYASGPDMPRRIGQRVNLGRFV